MIFYCTADSLILAQICVRFCKEWVSSQIKMQKFFNKKISGKNKYNKSFHGDINSESDSEDAADNSESDSEDAADNSSSNLDEDIEDYKPSYFFPFQEQFCTLGGNDIK